MNSYFRFKQFQVNQELCAMKVSTDSCLFGAWVAAHLPSNCGRILDIGAGTGLLSLMLAQACEATIDAVEIEEGCYGQLKENITQSPWSSRIHPVFDDIRNYQSSGYDLVITNPPFYEQQLASPDANTNAARHSSHLDLRELLRVTEALMSADGRAAILLPFYRKEELLTAAKEKGIYPARMADARHSPAHPWYRSMVMFTRHEGMVMEEQIDVRDEHGNYSQTFSRLLQPYYLFL